MWSCGAGWSEIRRGAQIGGEGRRWRYLGAGLEVIEFGHRIVRGQGVEEAGVFVVASRRVAQESLWRGRCRGRRDWRRGFVECYHE